MDTIYEGSMGSIPSDYTEVWRWVSLEETTLWIEATTIPADAGSEDRLYVTRPNAPKPGGTGPYLVEFACPEAMLFKAGNEEWAQIFGPTGNTPILNLKISGPKE